MSGVAKDGVDKVARDGDTDDELGGGGYEGGTASVAAGGEAQGEARRGGGGYDSGADGEVKRLISALEKRIKQLEDEAKTMKKELERKAKSSEGGRYELVNVKLMTPSTLKDNSTFRTWREEFERYVGLKVRGMQDVLKLIGGKRQWGTDLQEEVNKMLKELGYWEDRNEIDSQMRVALEAYIIPTREEKENLHGTEERLKGIFGSVQAS